MEKEIKSYGGLIMSTTFVSLNLEAMKEDLMEYIIIANIISGDIR